MSRLLAVVATHPLRVRTIGSAMAKICEQGFQTKSRANIPSFTTTETLLILISIFVTETISMVSSQSSAHSTVKGIDNVLALVKSSRLVKSSGLIKTSGFREAFIASRNRSTATPVDVDSNLTTMIGGAPARHLEGIRKRSGFVLRFNVC